MAKGNPLITKTKIELLRSNGSGLSGSIANAKHHAEAILPFINALKDKVGYLGFARWQQGSNVHQFTTTDGRKFTLRPYVSDKEYVGIRLSLRYSRSEEIRLADFHHVRECPALISMMAQLAGPEMGVCRNGLSKAE